MEQPIPEKRYYSVEEIQVWDLNYPFRDVPKIESPDLEQELADDWRKLTEIYKTNDSNGANRLERYINRCLIPTLERRGYSQSEINDLLRGD